MRDHRRKQISWNVWYFIIVHFTAALWKVASITTSITTHEYHTDAAAAAASRIMTQMPGWPGTLIRLSIGQRLGHVTTKWWPYFLSQITMITVKKSISKNEHIRVMTRDERIIQISLPYICDHSRPETVGHIWNINKFNPWKIYPYFILNWDFI